MKEESLLLLSDLQKLINQVVLIDYTIIILGGNTMANTSAVYARIDTNLKDNAESILSQLGISPSSAIQMFYSQIVLKKGMPFELKLPSSKPLAVGAMTREQLDAELQKGVDSIKAGKVYSADEVDAALAKEFDI